MQEEKQSTGENIIESDDILRGFKQEVSEMKIKHATIERDY